MPFASPSLQMTWFWPFLDQVEGGGFHCTDYLWFWFSDESNVHPRLGNLEGDVLEIPQILSDSITMWSAWWSLDQLSEDVTAAKKEPSTIPSSLCRIISNLSWDMLIALDIWFIINRLSWWIRLFSSVVTVTRCPGFWGYLQDFPIPS